MDKTEKVAKPKKSIQLASSPSEQQPIHTLQQALDLGLQHYTAGDYFKAEGVYQQILQANSNNPVALHLLGVVAHQMGKNDRAVDLIIKAVSIKPDYSEAHNNLGVVLKELGRLDEAVDKFQNAIAINPKYADAHNNLGTTFQDQGKQEEAVSCYKKSLVINPKFSEAYRNLGNSLYLLGCLDESAASYTNANTLKPQFTETNYSNLQQRPHSSMLFSDQLYNLFIATIPRSGTYFLANTFHNLAALYGCPEGGNYRGVKPALRAATLANRSNLGLRLICIGHMVCPRIVETLQDARLEKWEKLNFYSDAYCPFPALLKNDPAGQNLIDEGGGFDLNNRDVRFVFIFRNPLDQLVSMYNHLKNHKSGIIRGYFNKYGTFNYFSDLADMIINGALDSYLKLYASYAWSLPFYTGQIKMVSYESFIRDPLAGMKSILDFVDTMPDYELIANELQQALACSQPEALKRVENKLGTTLADDQIQTDGFNSHIRDGGTGRWKGLISDETIEVIERRFSEHGFSLNDFETGM